MKSKKQLFFLPFLCSVLIFLSCGTAKIVAETRIENIDFKKISDGVYTGDYKISPVQVAVEVTVKSGTVTNIAILRHFNGMGKKAEKITQDVLNSQSLAVDVVSGATGSSKCILKAVEAALLKGKQ